MPEIAASVYWAGRFEKFLRESSGGGDAAHDLEHVRRVVRQAVQLSEMESADLDVVLPAAWLHDCVTVSKNSPERSLASRMAADAAGDFLRESGFAAEKIPAIEHAIHAHSFSAGVTPETLEAKVVQDADRLDALGAVGIARTLMLGGSLGLPLYDSAEPIPVDRQPDDRVNTLDHFYVKLFRLASTMQTAAGRREAERRTRFMREYVAQLAREVGQEIPQ